MPGAKPSLLNEEDIVELRLSRMSQAKHRRLDLLWDECIEAECAR